ncbi:MAG: acetolactate synthase small subunit [Clostridia bacterium]|nr:acetolactate synthase small subunit [Clostridia bacterium]
MKQFVLSIRVWNKFGVLSRVASMFSRRGFNIDSLTVSATESDGVSRMTITATGDEYTKKQIVLQLNRLHEVISISEMPYESSLIRELLLIKIRNSSERHQEIMDAVNIFKANIIDYAPESFCIEVTGESSKLDTFISVVKPCGIIEMCRTGAVALTRGASSLKEMDMGYLNVYKKY